MLHGPIHINRQVEGREQGRGLSKIEVQYCNNYRQASHTVYAPASLCLIRLSFSRTIREIELQYCMNHRLHCLFKAHGLLVIVAMSFGVAVAAIGLSDAIRELKGILLMTMSMLQAWHGLFIHMRTRQSVKINCKPS
jgi:hypothetical protein